MTDASQRAVEAREIAEKIVQSLIYKKDIAGSQLLDFALAVDAIASALDAVRREENEACAAMVSELTFDWDTGAQFARNKIERLIRSRLAPRPAEGEGK